jgi:hypothetical protein
MAAVSAKSDAKATTTQKKNPPPKLQEASDNKRQPAGQLTAVKHPHEQTKALFLPLLGPTDATFLC